MKLPARVGGLFLFFIKVLFVIAVVSVDGRNHATMRFSLDSIRSFFDLR